MGIREESYHGGHRDVHGEHGVLFSILKHLNTLRVLRGSFSVVKYWYYVYHVGIRKDNGI